MLFGNDIAESIVYCSTAHEIWKELDQRFEKSNAAKIYQVQRDLDSVSQGNLSITAYFAKVKRLWDEHFSLIAIPPCSCGSAQAFAYLIHQQYLMQFLMGLNEFYNAIQGNIFMMQPLPPMNKIYNILLARRETKGDLQS